MYLIDPLINVDSNNEIMVAGSFSGSQPIIARTSGIPSLFQSSVKFENLPTYGARNLPVPGLI